MSQDDHYINGELLRLGREARGWVIGDMATRACMSVKQIRQLEEGGTSAFYSPAVKMTSAKKLAGILELLPEQVFKRPGSLEVETVPTELVEADAEHTADQPPLTEEVAPSQPAVVIEHEKPAPVDVSASSALADEHKGKTTVWAIAALFVASIGVAAYMKQQEEPVTEPPPPLQVMPTEVEPAASAADSVASTTSAPSERGAAPVASAPVVPASTPVAAAAATPASAAPKPAASAASKPL